MRTAAGLPDVPNSGRPRLKRSHETDGCDEAEGGKEADAKQQNFDLLAHSRSAPPRNVIVADIIQHAFGHKHRIHLHAYACLGTGNAVTDLIFSIAKRDVTFFSDTAPISRL